MPGWKKPVCMPMLSPLYECHLLPPHIWLSVCSSIFSRKSAPVAVWSVFPLFSHSTLHVFLLEHVIHHCIFVYISVSLKTLPSMWGDEGQDAVARYLCISNHKTWQGTGFRGPCNKYKLKKHITEGTLEFAANSCPMGKKKSPHHLLSMVGAG